MVEAPNYEVKYPDNGGFVAVPPPGTSVPDPSASVLVPPQQNPALFPSPGVPQNPPASSPGPAEGEAALTGVPFSFGSPPPPACSKSRCSAGHEWIPQLRIGGCPGCGAPMLVLLMQNCPVCNEPVAATRLRLDHMSQQSGQLMPICRGSATMAEALVVEMTHTHAADEEARHVVREVVSKV